MNTFIIMRNAVNASSRWTVAKIDRKRSRTLLRFSRTSVQNMDISGPSMKGCNSITMIRLTAFLALFPTMLLAGTPGELPSDGEIPRFIQVSDGLFRGGQPTQK